MLHLYQSNRLEILAQKWADIQRESPLATPLGSEHIIVQSQGMRRYLTHFLAQKQGIAANMRFYLPAQLSWHLMRELLPNIPALNPFTTEPMRWRLLGLFQSDDFAHAPDFQAAFESLRDYVRQGDYATYQLAGQIADIFDQYLVYRPDWIDAWTKNTQPPELRDHADAKWQTELWRYLVRANPDIAHRAQLWDALMTALKSPQSAVAPRYCVFGIATLAPIQLALIKQLSAHSEVHLFALNPSEHFWGNVIEPAAILNSGDVDLNLQGHPLLASLGKQGRDFFNQLTEVNAHTEHSKFDESPDESLSLLHALQWHIQTQTLPEESGFPIQHIDYVQNLLANQDQSEYENFQSALIAATENRIAALDNLQAAQTLSPSQIQAQTIAIEHAFKTTVSLHSLSFDESIQIHSTHSPLRELQILKDRLLYMLDRDPQLQAHDIAVLTPDIEPYAPFIDAVFGRFSPDSRPLPFSIADTKRSSRQPLMQAMDLILTALESRFESDTILALLECEALLRRFGLTREHLPLLRDTVRQLNIRWGADTEQRAQYGDNNDLFTWQQGLTRLILGWMLPEESQTLWQNISPFASHPDFMPIFGRFTQFVHRLIHWQRVWQNHATIDQWIERIRMLAEDLLQPIDDELTSLQQWEKHLTQWSQHAQIAHFHTPISAIVATQHLRQFLDSQSEAGFLRGGITFCSMVPMRSLPFKIVCLLGLNNGKFPRNTPTASFDLIAKHPRSGDRARRNDDRYLFLEAILSARQCLYLSFQGRDIRTDSECAPSVLLNELIDTIAAQTQINATILRQKWIIQHPLQAFSPRYFSGSPTLFSTREDYAQAHNQIPNPPAPFFTAPDSAVSENAENSVNQAAFLRFWRNPTKHFLTQNLYWNAPYFDKTEDSSEPFLPTQPRQLNDIYLRAGLHENDTRHIVSWLNAQSRLPAGELGVLTEHDYARQAQKIPVHLLRAPTRAINGIFSPSEITLHYALTGIGENGQIIRADHFLPHHNTTGSLNNSDKIELLLRHLIFCAVETPPDVVKNTHFIALTEHYTLPEISPARAQEILAKWLHEYRRGQSVPLPFFPRLQWKIAQEWQKDSEKTWGDMINTAHKEYHNHGNGKITPLKDYPEIRLIYGRNPDAPPPYLQPDFRELTETLLMPLGECVQALAQNLMA